MIPNRVACNCSCSFSRVPLTLSVRITRGHLNHHRQRLVSNLNANSSFENGSLSDLGSSVLMSGGDLSFSAGLGAAAVIVPVVGLAAWFFYLYSQLEFITAAMLTRHVPRGGNGASVIQVHPCDSTPCYVNLNGN